LGGRRGGHPQTARRQQSLAAAGADAHDDGALHQRRRHLPGDRQLRRGPRDPETAVRCRAPRHGAGGRELRQQDAGHPPRGSAASRAARRAPAGVLMSMREDHAVTERTTRMQNGNRFKLGLFGMNCSGSFATTAPERWQAGWDENLEAAHLADDAGLEFILPIARWLGYGGATDRPGTSFETLSWASALLAPTHHNAAVPDH